VAIGGLQARCGSRCRLAAARSRQLCAREHDASLHTRNARKLGESERRIYPLGAWRERDLYTEQERAALALTDAMTRLAETQDVPDEVYAQGGWGVH
jgi:alkylhydroperoxidase family enzyme